LVGKAQMKLRGRHSTEGANTRLNPVARWAASEFFFLAKISWYVLTAALLRVCRQCQLRLNSHSNQSCTGGSSAAKQVLIKLPHFSVLSTHHQFSKGFLSIKKVDNFGKDSKEPLLFGRMCWLRHLMVQCLLLLLIFCCSLDTSFLQ